MAWHRECLANHQRSVAEKRERLAFLAAELERSERSLAFHADQIATAEARGLEAFDRDRFLVKRTG